MLTLQKASSGNSLEVRTGHHALAVVIAEAGRLGIKVQFADDSWDWPKLEPVAIKHVPEIKLPDVFTDFGPKQRGKHRGRNPGAFGSQRRP